MNTTFRFKHYLAFMLALFAAMALCIVVGSVNLRVGDTAQAITNHLLGKENSGMAATILLKIRIPRVFSVALVGASLALAGAAMQGLLRNPLADGGTIGVSSGAALGAVTAIAVGVYFPLLPLAGTMVFAIVFAFASMLLVLFLAHSVDRSFSTQTIILMGVIFSMFAGAMISLLITFSGEKSKTMIFWSMGSLNGASYLHAAILLGSVLAGLGLLMRSAWELNAFAMGEEQAHHLGVDVKRVKLKVLIIVSFLIGISVSISGTIGFVGLIVPHAARLLAGPNHQRLLPASAFLGAVFLMLCDLVARTLLSPVELPIGIVTAIIGAVGFVFIFKSKMTGGRA